MSEFSNIMQVANETQFNFSEVSEHLLARNNVEHYSDSEIKKSLIWQNGKSSPDRKRSPKQLSPEQLARRRKANADRARAVRAAMSPEQRNEIRRINAERARIKRAMMTPEQRAEFRRINAERARLKRAMMSPEEQERVRRKNAEHARALRAAVSFGTRELMARNQAKFLTGNKIESEGITQIPEGADITITPINNTDRREIDNNDDFQPPSFIHRLGNGMEVFPTGLSDRSFYSPSLSESSYHSSAIRNFQPPIANIPPGLSIEPGYVIPEPVDDPAVVALTAVKIELVEEPYEIKIDGGGGTITKHGPYS